MPSARPRAPRPTSAGAVAGTVRRGVDERLGPARCQLGATTPGGIAFRSLQSATATVKNAAGAIVGTGAIDLTSAQATSAQVSGNVSYHVVGQGTVGLYAAATTGLGAGIDWEDYTADLTGTVTIAVTTDGLVLNGATLPAGTYLITTAAAHLTGDGSTPAANFDAGLTLGITDGIVSLGQGSGGLSIAGQPTDPGQGLTLTGFNGTATITADGGAGTDSVALNGQAAQVIQVFADPLTTDQNSPVSFDFRVRSSLAGTYTLLAAAPAGWTVAFDANGRATVTPAPGTSPGTYAIRLGAVSQDNPDLIASGEVLVTVTAVPAGVTLSIDPDPLYYVAVERCPGADGLPGDGP